MAEFACTSRSDWGATHDYTPPVRDSRVAKTVFKADASTLDLFSSSTSPPIRHLGPI